MLDTEEKQIAKRKTKKDRLKWAKKMYALDVTADKKFQKECLEDLDFVSGKQWKAETVAAMRLAGREPLTFNVIKPIADLISGIREQNEVNAKAYPTEINDEFLTEVINKIMDKSRSLYNVENEEIDAFEYGKDTGRGFLGIDVRVDPASPSEIKMDIQSIPPWEIRLDPAGRKDDLSDHSRITWTKWLSKEVFCASYPKFRSRIDDIMDGSADGRDTDWAVDYDDLDNPDITTEERLVSDLDDYNMVLDPDYVDLSDQRIKVCHMEYIEDYDRYYGFNPNTAETEEFKKENLKALQERIPNFDYFSVRDVKVKWLQWTGNVILYDGDSPMPFDGFSITPMFAYKERTPTGITHFGVVRPIKDPQREFNKRWSQELHLAMNQDQGGNFIEADALLNFADYSATKHMPGADTLLKPGGLGKIRAKDLPRASEAVAKMKQESFEIIKKISGVNPDLMGEGGRGDTPGVVVRLRQQQGLTILAPLFRNYKQMKKSFASKMIAIIMKYMPDSQIKRILGDDENIIIRQGVIVDRRRNLMAPLRDIRNVKYNVDIEESPANMTRNMYLLSVFFDSMEKGIPVPPELIIEKADVPVTEKRMWLEWIAQQQQGQSQMQQMQIQMQQQEMAHKQQRDMMRIQLDAQNNKEVNAIEIMKVQQEDKRINQEDLEFAVELVQDIVDKMAKKRSKNGGNGQGMPANPLLGMLPGMGGQPQAQQPQQMLPQPSPMQAVQGGNA